MSNEQDRDMAEVIAKIEKAMDEVSALCNGKKWRMCIPAERDSDSDLVIDDALHAAKDALLASSQGQGDGSHKSPFRGSFNPVCLQRHDSDLMVGICERDDAFELIVTPPRTGHQRHYRINADGSWTDQSHPQPDSSQGQGELPEVKHLDGAFCDLVVTYSQAEFLLSKATGRKITLGHYIRPQPDGLREACEALIKEWDRVFLRCSSTDVTTFMAAPIERFRATLAQADREAMG